MAVFSRDFYDDFKLNNIQNMLKLEEEPPIYKFHTIFRFG